MRKHYETNRLLRLNMQFFAADGAGSGTGDGASGDTGAEPGTGAADQNTNSNTDDNKNESGKSAEEIEKLIQSRVDKLMAENGKKNAALQKELDKLKKEKMTDDEIKAMEMTEKETALAEKERMLAEKENRLLAIKAIKAAGLDDGSDKSLELIDFVMGENEDAINTKVKAFGDLVKKFVAAEVDKTFKKNGRNPNGGSTGGDQEEKDNSIAERLGKARADKAKQSNDVLKFYTGGK